MLVALLACAPRPVATAPAVTPIEAAWAPESADARVGDGLSNVVAAIVDRYPTDGTYGFHWPPDDGVWWGTTRDIRYLGLLLSPGDPDHRSHCVGLTWEVAMEALSAAAGGGDTPINGLSLVDMITFRKDWFVRELGGKGPAEAVVNAGVGVAVPFAELRRGDFVQMWSAGGGGHSAVFDRWERDGDTIVGVRYWSTHPMLAGVGYYTDPFGTYALDRGQFYGARLARPEDWVAAR